MSDPAPGSSPTADEPHRIEVVVSAPADAVWQALRDKNLVMQWHGWQADELADEVDMIFFTDVDEQPDQRRLVANGGDTFEVVDLGPTSAVRLTRGPRDPRNEWDVWYDDINEGWTTFLHQLRFLLERHAADVRRTIFLDGGPGAQPPLAALGLDDVIAGGAGAPYVAELLGEPVRGEIAFVAANQAGVTVSAWGDGLLVAGVTPTGPHRPAAGAMAVLTTYGLDDDRFAELEQRWRTWWSEHFPAPEPTAEADTTEPAGEAVQ